MQALIFLSTLFFCFQLSSQLNYKAESNPVQVIPKGPVICGTCIDFADQFIDALLNIVLSK